MVMMTHLMVREVHLLMLSSPFMVEMLILMTRKTGP